MMSFEEYAVLSNQRFVERCQAILNGASR
jgi:hypothetical protein